MKNLDISYLAIPVNSSDEAESLANYLNEHGVCAFVQENSEVNCPLEHGSETAALIENMLKVTWRMYWENSGSSLFGMFVYTKD